MSILKDSVTPIESILDNMDFTYNEHILKNAKKIKEQIYKIMNTIKANPITFLK